MMELTVPANRILSLHRLVSLIRLVRCMLRDGMRASYVESQLLKSEIHAFLE